MLYTVRGPHTTISRFKGSVVCAGSYRLSVTSWSGAPRMSHVTHRAHIRALASISPWSWDWSDAGTKCGWDRQIVGPLGFVVMVAPRPTVLIPWVVVARLDRRAICKHNKMLTRRNLYAAQLWHTGTPGRPSGLAPLPRTDSKSAKISPNF